MVRVITSEIGGEGAPKKLIIKFRGLNPPSESSASGTSPPPPPSPAKPPKSSKRNLNHELDSVRTTKITPIRLKLSRSQQGYVSKTSCAEEESTSSGTAKPKSGEPAPPPSSSASETANSSLLPNESQPATKTAPPSHAVGGQGSSDGAPASNASATNTTAAVCLSDALSKS